MWRGLWGTAALVALIGVGAQPASAAGVCAGEDRPVQNSQDVPAARAAVLCLIEMERRSRGLPALVPNDRLDLAAQVHSQDMESRDYFAHTAPDPSPAGATADERARSAGYDVQLLRENLAGGLPVPRDLVLGWLQSEHHCENMLDPDAVDIGLGVVVGEFADTPGPAWTMLAATERSAVPGGHDGRPSAGCPYQQLDTGTRPVDPVVQQPAPAPPSPSAPTGSAVLGATAPGAMLPQASVQGLRVQWVDGLLQISGAMRPAWKGHRIVLRVARGKRVSRRVTRTGRDGRFVAILVVSPRGRTATAKVTVSGVPERLRTFTAARPVPRAVGF